MALDVRYWIDSVWMLVGIYWAVCALRSKPVARRQNARSRLLHRALMAVVLVLLFSNATRIGFLGDRFLPESSVISWAGFGFTVLGCAFAVWARTLLGANWSSAVTVKQNHEFIRRGPYAVVRHPIYAGLLLGILGTALALGEVRGLMAFTLAFAAYSRKARAEEEFLVGQFGDAYTSYCREVKQLLPYLL